MRQLRTWRCRAAALAAGLLLAGVAHAEPAWIRPQVSLNLRTGASNQHRIIGSVETGDEVQVMQRKENWTRVRTSEGKLGWIPGGYLSPEAPPTRRLQQLESETTGLRERLASLEETNARLESSNTALQERETGQRSELERLDTENRELKAGARWPEWITGATILAVGMAVGAILSKTSGRRASRRIRL